MKTKWALTYINVNMKYIAHTLIICSDPRLGYSPKTLLTSGLKLSYRFFFFLVLIHFFDKCPDPLLYSNLKKLVEMNLFEKRYLWNMRTLLE